MKKKTVRITYFEITSEMKYKKLLAIAFICGILIIWWKIVILKNSETINDKIVFILFFNSIVFISTNFVTLILSQDSVDNKKYNEYYKCCDILYYFNICEYIFFDFIKEIINVLGTFLLLGVIYVILCAFMFLFFNINLTEKIIILTKKIKITYENH